MIEATTRLELGLGGHTLSDTLLFGAKVLSSPGVLTPKNIVDIENNIVDGKTTWRHQNAYVKMVIAGCLNQARNIFDKFDEILDGPAPEELVVDTHTSIRKLLASQECQECIKQMPQDDKVSMATGDYFIRRIIEAVAPIIPITLRNKSLDGAYFRTALQLIAAAEFVFSQYEVDVRIKANPAGVVGMCNSMHGEIKRATMYNDGLKPLDDFIKDMKSQYQTYLGLGSAYARDVSIQGNRRGRRRRGQAPYHNRFGGQTFFRGQGRAAGYSRGRGSSLQEMNAYNPYGTHQSGDSNQGAMQTPGVCYSFQAGTCTRGRSCRFAHQN